MIERTIRISIANKRRQYRIAEIEASTVQQHSRAAHFKSMQICLTELERDLDLRIAIDDSSAKNVKN